MSRTYPNRPWVGIGVVVWRDDRVLLVRRAKAPNLGQWSLPGGGQDLGETVFEAAIREVAEETGLTIRPTAVLTAVDSIHRDEDGRVRYHYTLVEVGAEWCTGEAVARDDIDDTRWATLDEVDDLVGWSETRRVIRLSAEWRSGPAHGPRLRPRPRLAKWMRGPVGRLLVQPWLDTVTLRALSDWLFPMSRAWAAATVADGDPDRFAAEVPMPTDQLPRASRLAPLLADVSDLVRRHRDADADWQEILFHSDDEARRVAAEEARLDAAHDLTLAKLRFALMARSRGVEACRWETPSPADVQARHGGRLADPETAYALPERLPDVTETRTVSGDTTVDHWIRFDSPEPAVGSPCWARIHDPGGAPSRPTVVFLHGICVENDHLRAPVREVDALCAQGFRVIAIEGPWHGRRRARGRYGGEPVVAGTPMTALDYFSALVRELGIVTTWARRTGSVRVGWAATSLGAFTTQLAAVHAAGWPEPARADAMLLMATGDGLDEITLQGGLARGFGVDKAVLRAGWTAETLAAWRPLTDPLGPPVMGADRVVMVLGARDAVAPFDRGLAIAQRWGVPSSRLFIRQQGHFTVPAGILVDEEPVTAFAAALR